VSWLRGSRPRPPKPCTATSPKGYWCTRTDRHAQHEAEGGTGRIYASWRGDFPSEDELLETFTTEDGFRDAVGNTPLDDVSAADHNDLVKGLE
jgi:hypothetical protein